MKKFPFSLLALVIALTLGALQASAGELASGAATSSEGGAASWNEPPPIACGGTGMYACTNYLGVTGSSGSLAGTTAIVVPGSITYGPATTALEGTVWTFTVGGDTVTFQVTGPVDVITDNAANLDITAPGVWNETGFTATPGNFSLTLQDYSAVPDYGQTSFDVTGAETFSVAAPENVSTPEPSSLVLLGSGLLGAAFLLFRRNRTARRGSIT